MALNRPTLTQIISRISTDFVTSISGAKTLALRAVLRVMARVFGGAVHLIYGYADNILEQLYATTAISAYLDLMGSELGVPRKAATKASGSLTVTGIIGSVIPVNSVLQSSDGVRYLVETELTLTAGSGSLDVIAESAGANGNQITGATLTFVSPIAGVNSSTIVESPGLTGGADAESDTRYRARILARKRQVPHGGANHDLINWCLEVSGVTRAWAIDEYQGIGTVGIFFMRDDDTDPFPSSASIAAVRTYLESHIDSSGQTVGIPVTMKPGLYIEAPAPLTMNFTIKIYPNTATIQASITSEIEAMILEFGGPNQTVYHSQIYDAIDNVKALEYFDLVSPGDTTANVNQVHVKGTITYQSY